MYLSTQELKHKYVFHGGMLQMCLGIQAGASTKMYGTAHCKLEYSQYTFSRAGGMRPVALSHVSGSRDTIHFIHFIPVDI